MAQPGEREGWDEGPVFPSFNDSKLLFLLTLCGETESLETYAAKVN